MFEILRALWNAATKPSFEGFLGELWTVWQYDVGRAVLMARRSWYSIPPDIVRHAARIEAAGRAAQAQQGIDDAVSVQLGVLGITGGGGGVGAGHGTNPDQALFVSVMGSIRAHAGEPPVLPPLAHLAPAVLGGHVDPIQAMVQSSPAWTQLQLQIAVQSMQMMGMARLMRAIAVVQAATALPRDQIAHFLPPESGAPV